MGKRFGGGDVTQAWNGTWNVRKDAVFRRNGVDCIHECCVHKPAGLIKQTPNSYKRFRIWKNRSLLRATQVGVDVEHVIPSHYQYTEYNPKGRNVYCKGQKLYRGWSEG